VSWSYLPPSSSSKLDKGAPTDRDLRPGSSEGFQLLFIGTFDLGRIVESPVKGVVVAGEDRTGLAWELERETDLEPAIFSLEGRGGLAQWHPSWGAERNVSSYRAVG